MDRIACRTSSRSDLTSASLCSAAASFTSWRMRAAHLDNNPCFRAKNPVTLLRSKGEEGRMLQHAISFLFSILIPLHSTPRQPSQVWRSCQQRTDTKFVCNLPPGLAACNPSSQVCCATLCCLELVTPLASADKRRHLSCGIRLWRGLGLLLLTAA